MRSTLTLPRSTTNGLPAPSGDFEWRQAPWGDVLVCSALEQLASHFFTGRQLQLRGGSSSTPTRKEHALGAPSQTLADWGRVAGALGLMPDRLWRMRQVHGCDVFTVPADGDRAAEAAQVPPPQVDALITNRSDVALAVQVADCVPLLLADPRTGAVAATHAGWRGTAANVAAATVARLLREFDARPADLVAAIGPSIGPSCFQVGPDVRDAFLQASDGETVRPGAWFVPDVGDRFRLDLWRANQDQLVDAGLRPERVHVARLCTVTHIEHFFSYRREQQATGRMVGVIRRRDDRARADGAGERPR
jgi:YfiH family protein